MSMLNYLKRTTIANVVAGAVLILAVLYGIFNNNAELVKSLAYISAGYLLGITVPKREERTSSGEDTK